MCSRDDIMNALREYPIKQGAAKDHLLYLAGFADGAGREIFTSLTTMARQRSRSNNSITAHTKALIRDGILIRDKGGNNKGASVYHINLEQLHRTVPIRNYKPQSTEVKIPIFGNANEVKIPTTGNADSATDNFRIPIFGQSNEVRIPIFGL